MEQEYDVILNNLHLQNFIKDESLLRVLKQILDTITFFKIQEKDKELIEKKYQQKMENAIWSAVPNLSIIFAGGEPITMVVTAAVQIGVGYMHYRRNIDQYELDKKDQEWELQRSAIEQFNGLRRELFEAAWRLSDTYNFDDKDRLTEKQISRYNKILIEKDPLRRYEKLDVISDTFEAFPPFWYKKANAAKEIYNSLSLADKNTEFGRGFKKKALEAYKKFDGKYVKFMREDIIAASCALDHISLLDLEKDKDEIKRLLNKAVDLAGENFDVLQMCVLIYVAVEDFNSATETLQKLINEDYNIGLNGLLLSRIYYRGGNKEKYEILKKRIGETDVIPWIEDKKEEENYLKCRKNDIIERFETFLKDITNKYKNTFEKELEYKMFDEPPEKIKWFKSRFIPVGFALFGDYFPEMTKLLIGHLNRYFAELLQLNLFNIQRPKNNESWEKFFYDCSKDISKLIGKFNEEFTKTQEFISGCDVNIFNQLNHKKKLEMCQKIGEIVQKSEFCKFTEEFNKKLNEEFANSFSVESAESADYIIGSIDSWYIFNKINIPNKSSLANIRKEYFGYKDIIKI